MKDNIFFILNIIRYFPILLVYTLSSKKEFLIKERKLWVTTIKIGSNYSLKNFIWLLNHAPEFKNILFWRLGKIRSLPLRILYKQRESLHIEGMRSDTVAAGFIMQHGFSTIVEAASIGENCQIWHNVTVGTNISGSGNQATIGNNVKISAGAIVIGKIHIGDNSTIGAGCVVVKDVPDNCVVVGNPAIIVKRNNERVNIKL